jgi:hypothetical protein
VKVDTKIYNAWWDKYIKNADNWKALIEDVETYVDPTTEIQTSPTPTPTLSATIAQSVNSTTSTGTIGDTFKITWSSEGATKCEITKSINQKASYKWGWLPGSYSGNNLNGSANASPSVIGTHVFKITCTDKDQKTVEKSITHEVNSQQTQQAQGLSCPEGDDPNCDKHTCKDVWCATGCGNNMKKGTKDCSGV